MLGLLGRTRRLRVDDVTDLGAARTAVRSRLDRLTNGRDGGAASRDGGDDLVDADTEA